MASSGGWGFGRLFQYDPAELEAELVKRGAVIVDVSAETQIVLRKLGADGRDPEAQYLGEIHLGDLEPVAVRASTLSEIMMRVVGELAKMEHSPQPSLDGSRLRHVDSAGESHLLQLAPAEEASGVEPDVLALVFTREGDGAVRSVKVPAHTNLEALTGPELDRFLSRAR